MYFLLRWIEVSLFALAIPALAGDALTDEYNRAWAQVDRREYAAARAAAARIIDAHPEFWRAYSLLARASAVDGIAITNQPLLLRAAPHLRRFALGEWLIAHGEVKPAAEQYDACISADPAFAPCYFELARVLGSDQETAGYPHTVPATAPPALAAMIRAAELGGQHRFREEVAILSPFLNPPPADLYTEYALHYLVAGAYTGLGDQWNEAFQEFSRMSAVAERIGIWEPWMQAIYYGSMAARRAGRPDLAEEFSNQAADFARAHQLQSWLASMLVSKADQGGSGPDDALRFLLEARGLLLSMPGGDGAVIRASIAFQYARKGDPDSALWWYEQSIEAARANRQEKLAGLALRGKARVAAQRGDLFKAVENESESIRVFEGIHQLWQAGAGRGNLCEYYAGLGDIDSADRECMASYRSAVRFKDSSQVQSLLACRASLAVASGHPGRAIPLLRQSLEIGAKTGVPSFEIDAWIALSQAHRSLGDSTASAADAGAALSIAEKLGNGSLIAKASIELGKARLADRAAAVAAPLFEKVLESAKQSGSMGEVAEAHHGLARACLLRGDRQTALAHLEAAVEAVEFVRARVLAPELKTGFAQRNAAIFEDLVRLLAEMGSARRALEIAERGRARAFVDSLVESQADVQQALSPDDRARLQSLMAQLSGAYAAASSHPCAAHSQSVADAEARVREWTTGLYSRNPRYAGLVSPKPLDAAAIHALARREQITILAFALGDRASQAWVVNAHGTRMVRLPPRRSIEAAVRALRGQLAHPPQGVAAYSRFEAVSARVYRILLGGVPERDLTGRMVIVPDGLLHYVPFESLRDLNERAVISYAPSISALAELQRRRANAPQKDLLAFGAPNAGRGAGSASVVRTAYERAGWSLAPLPNARQELSMLGGMLGRAQSKVVSGAAATEAAFKSEALDRYRRIHLASHALLDEAHPQRSGIVLSSSAGEDGILRSNEIVNLRLNADLVVVSACQTGLGKLARGEGVLGLTRSLMYAGARRLAVSLWPVNDAATTELMRLFYSRMRSGDRPAEALRSARQTLARNSGPAYRHPYFWAPFVVVGLP